MDTGPSDSTVWPTINFGPFFVPCTFHHLHGICGGLAKQSIAPSSRHDIHQWPIITLHGKTIELWHPFSITVAARRSDFPIVYQLVFPPGVINTRVVSAEEEAACNNHHHRRRRCRAAIFALAKKCSYIFCDSVISLLRKGISSARYIDTKIIGYRKIFPVA